MSSQSRKQHNNSFPHPEFNADKVRNRGVAETGAAQQKHDAALARLSRQPATKGDKGGK